MTVAKGRLFDIGAVRVSGYLENSHDLLCQTDVSIIDLETWTFIKARNKDVRPFNCSIERRIVRCYLLSSGAATVRLPSPRKTK
jgi:hypothetical protein